MPASIRTIYSVDVGELQERLERLVARHPRGALVFDADGTLWSHDVGCMVFEAAYQQGVLREAARLPLRNEARRLGLDVPDSADANVIAARLQHAYVSGEYALKATAEMQVWAYAGLSESELRGLCRQALSTERHDPGIHAEVVEIARWARARDAQVFVVSASPRIIVEEALRRLDIGAECIAAGDPNWENGRIAPGMGAPLPYGVEKARAGRRLLADSTWLATFGDSGFDVAMMHEAHLAVGLGASPELLAGLASHPNAVLLALTPQT